MFVSLLSTMICLIISSVLLISLVNSNSNYNSRNYLKKENSLIKPYNDDRWDLLGSAMILNNFVRLTPDQQSRKGAIWNNVPCKLVDWEMHVHFKVHGIGADISGDGFAVWYVRDRMNLGTVFGSKDHFYGIGVLFDTYSNYLDKHKHGFPYISVMVNNGTLHYDHDSDGTGSVITGCEAHFRNLKTETFIAIRYENKKLTISLDIDGKSTWTTCTKIDNLHLPTGLYFGASAATGGLSDNHDIISMKLYDIGNVETDNEDESSLKAEIVPSIEGFEYNDDAANVDNTKGKPWSVLFTLFVIFLVIVLLIFAGFGAYFIYESRQNKKRFY